MNKIEDFSGKAIFKRDRKHQISLISIPYQFSQRKVQKESGYVKGDMSSFFDGEIFHTYSNQGRP